MSGYPLRDVAAAHRESMAGHTTGKIVWCRNSSP
ncbi:zinc-binding dehydrogenase [Streptomyces massasporeus]